MATKRTYNMGTRATEFSKLIQSMTGKHQLWEIWADFVTMAACCISNSVDSGNRERREDLYNRTAGKYEQDEINNMGSLLGLVILALEEEPEQDFLGEMYMQLELGSHWHGQFFTPYNVGTFLLTTVLLTTCFIRRFVQTAALRWTERNGRTMSNVDIMFTHKDEEAPEEMVKQLPNCPVCGAKAYLHGDTVDGFWFGWSIGCPRYCLNDGIHGHDLNTPLEEYLAEHGFATKEQAVAWWEKRVKLNGGGTNGADH